MAPDVSLAEVKDRKMSAYKFSLSRTNVVPAGNLESDERSKTFEVSMEVESKDAVLLSAIKLVALTCHFSFSAASVVRFADSKYISNSVVDRSTLSSFERFSWTMSASRKPINCVAWERKEENALR